MTIRNHRGISYDVREAKSGEHSDVEYHVSPLDNVSNSTTFITCDSSGAQQDAIARAMQGQAMVLDVCIFSEDGANYYGGDDGLELYREDPDASVFERFEVTCNFVGKVA